MPMIFLFTNSKLIHKIELFALHTRHGSQVAHFIVLASMGIDINENIFTHNVLW